MRRHHRNGRLRQGCIHTRDCAFDELPEFRPLSHVRADTVHHHGGHSLIGVGRRKATQKGRIDLVKIHTKNHCKCGRPRSV